MENFCSTFIGSVPLNPSFCISSNFNLISEQILLTLTDMFIDDQSDIVVKSLLHVGVIVVSSLFKSFVVPDGITVNSVNELLFNRYSYSDVTCIK